MVKKFVIKIKSLGQKILARGTKILFCFINKMKKRIIKNVLLVNYIRKSRYRLSLKTKFLEKFSLISVRLKKLRREMESNLFRIKIFILKIFFGEMYIFKREEYTISFEGMPLLTFTNLNQKLFSDVWSFIYSSCLFYNSYQDYKLSSYQQEEINKFFEQFPIVSKEDYFDKENNDIIGIYKNYFKMDPKGKILRSNMIELSKKINYPPFVLEVIKLYSTMLQTYGDPELDLIPNKKDRLAIMNVDLSYFISTKEQLEIFIESLELELKDAVYSESIYRSYIERLIRTLKLFKDKFKDSSSRFNIFSNYALYY